MYKSFYIVVICLLFSSNAFAENNIFCNNQPSSDMGCVAISQIMYQGVLSGYVKAMLKHQQEKGLETDAAQTKAEIMDLLPYNTFHGYFQKCGESEKDFNSAQACILSNIQNLMLSKHTQKPEK